MGAALCLGIAGESFRPNAEGGHRPRTLIVDAAVDVVDAAETCPVQAISITDPDPAEPPPAALPSCL
nr:ferredoxin [Streptomyces sp. ODS05-4]